MFFGRDGVFVSTLSMPLSNRMSSDAPTAKDMPQCSAADRRPQNSWVLGAVRCGSVVVRRKNRAKDLPYTARWSSSSRHANYGAGKMFPTSLASRQCDAVAYEQKDRGQGNITEPKVKLVTTASVNPCCTVFVIVIILAVGR